jgi:uncharacterized protein CbrC (UPF0167 family)
MMQSVPTKLLLGASVPLLGAVWGVGSFALDARDSYSALQADARAAIHETHELHARIDDINSNQQHVFSRLDAMDLGAVSRSDLDHLKDEIGHEITEAVQGERIALDLHLQSTLNEWDSGSDEGRLLILEDGLHDLVSDLGDLQSDLDTEIYDLQWQIEQSNNEISTLKNAEGGASAYEVRALQEEVRILQADMGALQDRINSLMIDVTDLFLVLDDVERLVRERGY